MHLSFVYRYLDKLTVCASDEGLLDSLCSKAQLFLWQCGEDEGVP